MNRLQRDSVLLLLIEKLREHGNWCGETHIQKATYFLQDMLCAPTGFEFILYKHGPFSFDLRDELTAMRADGFILLRSESPPYGPSFFPDSGAVFLKTRFPKTLARYRAKVEFVAQKFGRKNVTQLERLATSLYVSHGMGFPVSVEDRAQRVRSLKPHIDATDAKMAVVAVDEWEREARELAH